MNNTSLNANDVKNIIENIYDKREKLVEEIILVLKSKEGIKFLEEQIKNIKIKNPHNFTIKNFLDDIDSTIKDKSLSIDTQNIIKSSISAESSSGVEVKTFKEVHEITGKSGDLRKILSSAGASLKLFSGVTDQVDDFISKITNLDNPFAPGVFAGLVALVVSGGFQYINFQKGLIRLDDAVDKVVGDSIKAGITGAIVIPIAAGIAGCSIGSLTPLAIAISIPLSLIVYSIVSAICDEIYENILGGKEIQSARKLHYQYLEMSHFLKSETRPKLKQIISTGEILENICLNNMDKLKIIVNDNLKLLLNNLNTKDLIFKITKKDKLMQKYIANNFDFISNDDKKTDITIRFIRKTSEIIHKLYWDEVEKYSKRKKPNIKEILEKWEQQEKFKNETERQEKKQLATYIIDLEKNRFDRNAPIIFELSKLKIKGKKIKKIPNKIACSDLLELFCFIELLRNEKWTQYDKPKAKDISFEKSLPYNKNEYLKKCESSMNAFDSNDFNNGTKYFNDIAKKIYNNLEDPFNPKNVSDNIINPLYKNGMFQEFLRNEHFLYRISGKVNSEKNLYISIRNTGESKKTLQERLERSFQLNPLSDYFDLNYNEISIKDHINNNGIFTLIGFQLYPMEVYTATIRTVTPNTGSTEYSIQDFYFVSLAEAYTILGEKHKDNLVGIRPGAKILSDDIKDNLVNSNDFWLIENQLIRRIGIGLILLDDLSDDNEKLIARIAGDGVIVSWFRFFSNRIRKDLIKSLRYELVKQSLRYEIMVTTIELQKLHLQSKIKELKFNNDF